MAETKPACYLTFDPASGGAFFMHWSETMVDGALACFVPAKPIPKFKFNHRGGRSEFCRGIAGGNKKPFYNGWCSFVREAYKNNADLTFIQNGEENPVGLYLVKKDTTVVKVNFNEPVHVSKDSGEFAVVGVIPSVNNSFDVQKMLPSLFTSVGEEHGAALSLE